MLPALLLALTLAALAWFVRGDLGEYRRFKALNDTAARQARYRLWMAKAWLAIALPALAGLLVLERVDATMALPPEFADIAKRLPQLGGSHFLLGALIGAAGGGMALGLLIALRRGRGKLDPPGTVGDIGALLPRNRAEVLHAAILSVTAGVTEELAFRLFLPLLLVLNTGNAIVALAVAAAAFGAMHLYQGWVGVAATTCVGLAMTFLYLASGSLALAMLMHVLIDLNGLVLRPVLNGAWRINS